MKRALIGLALCAIIPTASAQAIMAGFCMEPQAPSLLFVRKPSKPFCAASRSCEEYEVEAYKYEVERYFRKLREYADSVDTFYRQASEYVECMTKLD